MTAATAEKRLAEIEAKAKQLYPPPETPPGLAWIAWTSDDELDQLERLASAATIDGQLGEDAERRWLSIHAAALSRQLGGLPEYLADPDRYVRVDHPDWPCWRNGDALPPI
jgi:hypothetical protein